MKKSRAKLRKVTPKSSAKGQGEEKSTLSWQMEGLLSEVAGEIEAFSARIGLHIMQAVMEHEVVEKVGVWGQQKAYRHGTQPGYVVYGGRKRRRAESESTVVCRAYFIVTPPPTCIRRFWTSEGRFFLSRSFSSLFFPMVGTICPNNNSEGLPFLPHFTGSPFPFLAAWSESGVHSQPIAR